MIHQVAAENHQIELAFGRQQVHLANELLQQAIRVEESGHQIRRVASDCVGDCVPGPRQVEVGGKRQP